MSRGLTNRNPGNIRRSQTRYKGEVTPSRDPAFKEFQTAAWGYRAIFVLLYTYWKRYHLNTVETMISRWAPPTENHTRQYIRYVADAIGVVPDEPIDTLDVATMIPFAAAISEVENGAHARREEVDEGWKLFRADFGKK
ncbi:MAG: structural protein P5 [Alistipes sp.]